MSLYAKYKDIGSNPSSSIPNSNKRPQIAKTIKSMSEKYVSPKGTHLNSQNVMSQQPMMMNSHQPMMNSQQPMMNSQQPMMNSHQPMMNSHQPMMMNSQQPMMNSHQPMMNSHQPMMNSHQPMMMNSQQLPPIPQQIPQQFQQTSQRVENITNSYGTYTVESEEYKNNLVSSNDLVVVDIWGSFCGPCKQIAPRYEELAQKYNSPGKIILAKEDITLGISQNVKGVPTFQFYKSGQLIDTVIGADIVSVENKIQQYS